MIGHAMASLRPIHHGRSVALGMIATLAWSAEADDARFGAAARAMGVASAADLPRRLRRRWRVPSVSRSRWRMRSTA